MRKFNLFAVAMAMLCGSVFGQGVVSPGKDVPEIADHEIRFRGNMAQEIGTIQADEIDVIADALAPPADDSHKWWITLVTKDNDKVCEKLKYDLIHTPELKSWVNVDEPGKSYVHYQCRRFEDVTQADWIAPLKERIEKGGVPMIIVQPPKNGEYGLNKHVIAALHGYNGKPDELIKLLGREIKAYVSSLHRKGLITHVGDNAIRGGHALAGDLVALTDPPFQIERNKIDPFQPKGPHDWPPAIPLTLEEIVAAAPGAPADFILGELVKKPTDPATVTASYKAYQQAQSLRLQEESKLKVKHDVEVNEHDAEDAKKKPIDQESLEHATDIMPGLTLLLLIVIAGIVGTQVYLKLQESRSQKYDLTCESKSTSSNTSGS